MRLINIGNLKPLPEPFSNVLLQPQQFFQVRNWVFNFGSGPQKGMEKRIF